MIKTKPFSILLLILITFSILPSDISSSPTTLSGSIEEIKSPIIISRDTRTTLYVKVRNFSMESVVFDVEMDIPFNIATNYQRRKSIALEPRASGTVRYSLDIPHTTSLTRYDIKTRFASIDIGVRIEVPAVVMDSIIKRAWDPKFHIYTKTYDDFVRTFCTCPNGFVVMEDYGEYIGVNGHSSNKIKSFEFKTGLSRIFFYFLIFQLNFLSQKCEELKLMLYCYDQLRSKRSRFIILFHTATKSRRNFSWESLHP